MPDDTTRETTTTDAANPADTSGLVKALNAERAANKELRGRLKQLEESIAGIDVEELKRQSTKATRTADQERERASNLEKQLKDLQAQLTDRTKMADTGLRGSP